LRRRFEVAGGRELGDDEYGREHECDGRRRV
jgi:hypothetical protein